MLNTSQIPEKKDNIKKTLSPGNTVARITDLQLVEGYSPGSKHLVLHLESEPIGEDFEGFYIDKNNPSLGRYNGQIGRVKFSRYAFEDGTTKSGYRKNRNIDCARAILDLGKALGVADKIHGITADIPGNPDAELDEFIKQARAILIKTDYMNYCIGGREYMNKNNYIDYDLFLPYEKGKAAFEATGIDSGKLLSFSESKHIILVKDGKSVDSFEPANTSSDFEL